MYDEIPTGPTGEFPDGKIRADDRGETVIVVGVNKGNVVIDFGAPTAWVGFPPETARRPAAMLLRRASEIDGVPIRIEF